MRRRPWLLIALVLVSLGVVAGVQLHLRAQAEAAMAPDTMPFTLGVGGNGVMFERHTFASVGWLWGFDEYVLILRDALAGINGRVAEVDALPFEFDGLPGSGAELVSVKYDPPIRLAVRPNRITALALYAISPSDRVDLYLRSLSGRWYRYDTTVPASRLTSYRVMVVERLESTGGD